MNRAMRCAVVLAIGLGAGHLAAQVGPRPEPVTARQPPAGHDGLLLESISADSAGLDRMIRVSDRIYSGAEPSGDIAFGELAAMGVRTVVCVDGARPQVLAAAEHGLRYVHVPISYDRIAADASGAITRVVREVDGPIYIHCHHGRHRGPAAAAIACIADGAADGPAALRVLETAGTSREYPGLWRDVRGFRPPPVGAELPELSEVARLDSLTTGMAEIDRVWDHLEMSRDAEWTTPVDHPDIVPARESLILSQRFQDMLQSGERDDDPRFRDWLHEAARHAKHLHAALTSDDADQVNQRFGALRTMCDRCHQAYRDR